MSMLGPGGGMPVRLPSRIIQSVQRYSMPDATVREKRYFQVTHQAPDGSTWTEEFVDVHPPLDDGFVPEDMTDVLYCLLCKSLVCRSVHSFVCRECGQTFCVGCRVRVGADGGEMTLCRPCAENAMEPRFLQMFRKAVWGE